MQRVSDEAEQTSSSANVAQQSGSRALNGSADFLQQFLMALQAMRDGDFSVRMAADSLGVEGKIADTFNEIIAANHRMAKEFERVGRTSSAVKARSSTV